MPDEFLRPRDEFYTGDGMLDDAGDEDIDELEQPLTLPDESDPEKKHAKIMDDLHSRMDAMEARTRQKMDVLMDCGFFACVVFESAAQVEEWIEKAGLEDACDKVDPQYMDGIKLAALMGIEITPTGVELKEKKIQKRYLDMSDPLP